MDSIWTRDGAPAASHFLVAAFFVLVIIVCRLFLDRFVFRRLASCLRKRPLSLMTNADSSRSKLRKCSESMWKLTYYATVEICILSIAYNQPWFRDVKQYFKGWPDQELSLSLKLYYMCQCGFYTYSIGALLMWETRRKDFSVMMSHHIVTVFLIGYSYITSFFRIGSVILALHDASDVFLEAAKSFNYSDRELGASVFFGIFAFSWIVLRLIFFPFWVIRSSSCHICDFIDLSVPYNKMLYYIFNTMLLTLLVFHIYWWKLIYLMIIRQLKNRGKVGEDIRSDSEDEND